MTAIRIGRVPLRYFFAISSLVDVLGEIAQDVANLAADHLMLQGIGDGGFDESGLVSAIEAPALEAIAVEGTMADHAGKRIGQLHLAARARRLVGDQVEDLG